MANKNTKAKAALAAKELAQKKKGNGDFRNICPPRKNGQKDMDMYKKFPGFRKEPKKAA